MEAPPPSTSGPAVWLIEKAGPIGLLVALATAVAVVGVTRLDFSDNPRDLFARDDQASRRLDALHESFGADDTQVVLMLQGESLLERDALQRLRSLVRELRDDPDLVEVYSLLDARRTVKLGRRTMHWMIVPSADRTDADYREVRERLLQHPLLTERMISSDGKTTVILAQVDDSIIEVARVAEVTERITLAAQQAFAGSSIGVRISGQPSLRVETLYNLKTDQLTFSLLCGTTLFVISLLLFRRLQPVIVSLAGPGVGVVWALGGMGWTAQRMDGINVVLPTLLMVIGFTDSLHLVMAMRAFQRLGHSPREASTMAVGLVGKACLLTSLTTAIGFGSLSLSSLGTVHRFGVYSAAGAAGLYVAVMSIVPLLPLAPWFGKLVGDSAATSAPNTTRAVLPFRVLGRLIVRRREAIAIAAIISTGLLAYAGQRLPYDMHWSEALPAGSEVVQTTRRLDEVFGGSIFAHVVVQWPKDRRIESSEVLDAVVQLQTVLEGFSEQKPNLPLRFGKPVSIVNVLDGLRPPGGGLAAGLGELRRRMPERYRRLVREDERRLVVNVPIPEAGARALLPMFNAVDRELERWQASRPGFSAELTGTTVLSARNLHEVIYELYRSVLAAAVIVFVVLCFAFRSLRLGLISVIPNLFPLLAVTACLALTEIPMQITAALTLCLSLGIAVDDTIHLVERFRRESACGGGESHAACRRAYVAVGEVIVLTTIVLVCGFATMLVSRSPAIRLFGGATCVALVAALIGDLLFLPALLAVGARRLRGKVR